MKMARTHDGKPLARLTTPIQRSLLHRSQISAPLTFALLLSLIAVLGSCTSTRPTGFALQEQVELPEDKKPKLILSELRPIDSVDVSKLAIDIWKIETKLYPDSIRMNVRVFDSSGNIVTHMAPPYREDQKMWKSVVEKIGKSTVGIPEFWVREFGAKDSIPYSIVLTVDYSGSVSGVLDALVGATKTFVSMKMPYDRIALTTFNRAFDIKVPLWQDKEAILSRYASNAKTGTGLYSAMLDAVSKSIDLFDETTVEGQRVMVVFSDGEDNFSTSRLGKVLELARKKDVTIFTIGFGYPNDEILKPLADYTGGKFYVARSKEELEKIFQEIYRSLRNFYRLSYKPPFFRGMHYVTVGVQAPGRADTLKAKGQYDTAPLLPDFDVGSQFSAQILFDFNKAELKQESMVVIDELVELMQRYPKVRLEVQGHTDNVGLEDYNQRLSELRAQAVVDAMIAGGVETKRLRSRGLGMSRPLETNATEEGRAKNRRTQFVVLAK